MTEYDDQGNKLLWWKLQSGSFKMFNNKYKQQDVPDGGQNERSYFFRASHPRNVLAMPILIKVFETIFNDRNIFHNNITLCKFSIDWFLSRLHFCCDLSLFFNKFYFSLNRVIIDCVRWASICSPIGRNQVRFLSLRCGWSSSRYLRAELRRSSRCDHSYLSKPDTTGKPWGK